MCVMCLVLICHRAMCVMCLVWMCHSAMCVMCLVWMCHRAMCAMCQQAWDSLLNASDCTLKYDNDLWLWELA